MPANSDDPREYRYERKFVVHGSEHELVTLLRVHPAMFSEIYGPRHVNNIYFDSESIENYFDNLDGREQRLKCRIRWYGDLFGVVKQPMLEFKIKQGLVGRKERFAIRPFRMDKSFSIIGIREALDLSDLSDVNRHYLKAVTPTLLNRYLRRYFLTHDRAFRVTIDSQMQFYRLARYHNTFMNSVTDRNLVVEMKYDRESEVDAHRISQHLGFRLAKNSKYVTGLDHLSAW